MFVHANLSCSELVEIPYYSSGLFVDVCIHCGTVQDISGKSNVCIANVFYLPTGKTQIVQT